MLGRLAERTGRRVYRVGHLRGGWTSEGTTLGGPPQVLCDDFRRRRQRRSKLTRFARWFPHATVWAFEPFTEAFDESEHTTRGLNACRLKLALGSRKEKVTVGRPSNVHGVSSYTRGPVRPGTGLAEQFYLARTRASLFRELGAAHSLRRWRTDRHLRTALPARREAFTRRMWAEAAAAVGASFSEPAPRLFEFSREGLSVHVLGQRTPFADPVSIELASAKDLAYELLARANVRVPEHLVLRRSDRRSAHAFLESGPGPLVVKPARGGGGGLGVTPSIRNTSQLERALRRAGSSSERLIVERQVEGEHYRFLLLDGEVLDVIRRGRPQVVGDGTSTIEELMFAEYERRLATDATEGMKPFPVDLDCLFTLERQGLRLSTRVPQGTTVVVKSATNISGGRTCVTVREPVAPEVAHDVRAAAVAVGVRLAGVDVVAPDIERSLTSSNGVVLEVNPIPGLQHHYNVAEPEAATVVAVPVLETLFAQRAAAAHA